MTDNKPQGSNYHLRIPPALAFKVRQHCESHGITSMPKWLLKLISDAVEGDE